MRELRFRVVFEDESHIWAEDIEWPFFVVDSNTIWDARKDKREAIKVKAVLQYVGMCDKNKQEICEGDVLRYKNLHLKKYSTISWSEKDARFIQRIFVMFKTPKKENVRTLVCNMKKINQMEVIGNIYENKDLKK